MEATLNSSRLNLSPKQKAFCTSLFDVIARPEFDLLDQDRVSVVSRGDKLFIVLPHRVDPSMTITTRVGLDIIESLVVWNFEFINLFQVVGGGLGGPDNWVIKLAELLSGRMCLEKWIKGNAVVQLRSNYFSKDLGKWAIGNAIQSQPTRFLGIKITVNRTGRALPKGSVREEKHVSFCSNHGIPRFEEPTRTP